MNAAVVEIADPGEALTFARIAPGGSARVIAVTAWSDSGIDAVDLGAAFGARIEDAASLLLERGYDAVADLVTRAPVSARVVVDERDLVAPVDFGDRHIAVGTNYPEHASDAGTTRPFLFPKLVQPGLSGDTVSTRGGLLDYEVEIAVLLFEPLRSGVLPGMLGLLLANDFTDRETLMHAVDRHDIESGKGFTTGKSFPGYLPVGALLVVPRDYRSFVRGIDLQLRVNGQLRQQSVASNMVWDIDEILAQTLARNGKSWEHRGRLVTLFDGDAVPPRTLVLTGTPEGTVFDGVPARVIAAGLLRWLAGGWSSSIPTRVIEAYCASSRAAKAYLQPGDEVLIRVQKLGRILSRVVD